MTISALFSATSSSAISVWRIQDCAATVVSRLIGSGQNRATSRTISTTLSLFFRSAASSKQSVVFPTPCVPMKAIFISRKRLNVKRKTKHESISDQPALRFTSYVLRFTSAGRGEPKLAAQLLPVRVERGRKRDRRGASVHADRGSHEGHTPGRHDGLEGSRGFRPQCFEGPAGGARRDLRVPQARQPDVARLAPEDLPDRGLERRAVVEARRVGPIAGVFRPLRKPEHPGQPRELPVRGGGDDEIG